MIKPRTAGRDGQSTRSHSLSTLSNAVQLRVVLWANRRSVANTVAVEVEPRIATGERGPTDRHRGHREAQNRVSLQGFLKTVP